VQIEIELNGERFSATVDTAAPFFICNLAVAESSGLATTEHVGVTSLLEKV
jgi:hypothetical protein